MNDPKQALQTNQSLKAASSSLGLTKRTISVAQIILNFGLSQLNMDSAVLIPASLFLSTKITENFYKLETIAAACSFKDTSQILKAECEIAASLNFNFDFFDTYQFLLKIGCLIEIEDLSIFVNQLDDLYERLDICNLFCEKKFSPQMAVLCLFNEVSLRIIEHLTGVDIDRQAIMFHRKAFFSDL